MSGIPDGRFVVLLGNAHPMSLFHNGSARLSHCKMLTSGGHCLAAPTHTHTSYLRFFKCLPWKNQNIFQSILSLFSKENFDDENIEEKRNRLASNIVQKYCQGKTLCNVVVPEIYTTEVSKMSEVSEPPSGPSTQHCTGTRATAVSLEGSVYVTTYSAETSPPKVLHVPLDCCPAFPWSVLWQYHLTSNSWKQIDLPQVGAFALVASSQSIFLVGGSHKCYWSHTGQIYEIDLAHQDATTIGQLHRPRSWLAAAVNDEWLYAIGGGIYGRKGKAEAVEWVEAFNIQNFTLKQHQNTEARMWPAIATVDDAIVVGGIAGPMDPTWSPLSTSAFAASGQCWIKWEGRCSCGCWHGYYVPWSLVGLWRIHLAQFEDVTNSGGCRDLTFNKCCQHVFFASMAQAPAWQTHDAAQSGETSKFRSHHGRDFPCWRAA